MFNDYKSFILQKPDKRLRQVCLKVTNFKEAKEIADKLIEITKKVDGPLKISLGMAAPQVGYDKRVIILRKSQGEYTVMVNPKIVKQKWNLPIFSRCFSVDGVFIIKSPYWIKIEYQDLQGNYNSEVLRGVKAVTLQQEIDHINGVLISDIGLRLL
ncbi:peptide deformylase [Candidatus Daviesbacteria bacterium]|nr:peptide deformylase [Candidatus Daviesbacteria bacterium]